MRNIAFTRFVILLEFIGLCIVMPTYIWMTNSGDKMFLFLWLAAIFCLAVLIFRRQIDWKQELKFNAFTRANLIPICTRFVLATIFIIGFTAWYEPERLFHIPLHAPHILPFLFLVYPFLSALPQEFIFCSFFMKRYGLFLKQDWAKILLSALVFGYAHMLFINWVAPVFSFAGGLIFAHTYLKTRSLALVTFEHSLYGNAIFIAGIGYYFYSGGIAQ